MTDTLMTEARIRKAEPRDAYRNTFRVFTAFKYIPCSRPVVPHVVPVPTSGPMRITAASALQTCLAANRALYTFTAS